jgi:hypothetical protein
MMDNTYFETVRQLHDLRQQLETAHGIAENREHAFKEVFEAQRAVIDQHCAQLTVYEQAFSDLETAIACNDFAECVLVVEHARKQLTEVS